MHHMLAMLAHNDHDALSPPKWDSPAISSEHASHGGNGDCPPDWGATNVSDLCHKIVTLVVSAARGWKSSGVDGCSRKSCLSSPI